MPSPESLSGRLDALENQCVLWRTLRDELEPVLADPDGKPSTAQAVKTRRRAEIELESHAFDCAEAIDHHLAEMSAIQK